MDFKQLHAPYSATGDQPEAIRKLDGGRPPGLTSRVLLGVTGLGKTFTMHLGHCEPGTARRCAGTTRRCAQLLGIP